ncbi:MAG: hypothetical protein ACYDH3_10595 [Candidatus Aminicenantales bacterium]
MNYKRVLMLSSLVFALVCPLLPALQDAPAQTQAPAKAQSPVPEPVPEMKMAPPVFSYDPAGRRDPFKDLFGGKEVRDKKVISGLADMEIDDITLMGIVKTPERYEAIVAFADGFPLTLLKGQKLADGFVLSIEADRVVFRKTNDKGLPLAKPKDIIKEIAPEEPAHD